MTRASDLEQTMMKNTKRNTEVTGSRVDVRLDNNAPTSVTLADAGGYASGQRVRVVNGSLQPA